MALALEGLVGKHITLFFDDGTGKISRKSGSLKAADASFLVMVIDGVEQAIAVNRVVRLEPDGKGGRDVGKLSAEDNQR